MEDTSKNSIHLSVVLHSYERTKNLLKKPAELSDQFAKIEETSRIMMLKKGQRCHDRGRKSHPTGFADLGLSDIGPLFRLQKKSPQAIK